MDFAIIFFYVLYFDNGKKQNYFYFGEKSLFLEV